MAKTWQNVLDEARVILQDTDSPYRHSTTVLTAKLNRGLQELRRLRPDAFWDMFDRDDVTAPEIVAIDSDEDDEPEEFDPDEDGQIGIAANFNLDMMFYAPLVYWVASSAELVDDEFTNDGRVMMLMTQFKTMVVSL